MKKRNKISSIQKKYRKWSWSNYEMKRGYEMETRKIIRVQRSNTTCGGFEVRVSTDLHRSFITGARISGHHQRWHEKCKLTSTKYRQAWFIEIARKIHLCIKVYQRVNLIKMNCIVWHSLTPEIVDVDSTSSTIISIDWAPDIPATQGPATSAIHCVDTLHAHTRHTAQLIGLRKIGVSRSKERERGGSTCHFVGHPRHLSCHLFSHDSQSAVRATDSQEKSCIGRPEFTVSSYAISRETKTLPRFLRFVVELTTFVIR